MSVLDGVTGPADVRRLPATVLPTLAAEIRELLIDSVPRTSGHLGPNLGVVELTIGLHRVFDSPTDAIIWDTGHQAYVHKLLTGRRDGFARLRSAGGLSGYPSRAESEHDLVENSHASTALSYADGLARAFALRGQPDRAVVAVVGDGALTGGMCWEALNNIGGSPQRPVIVVLNDNGRSYSPTVGSLPGHLGALRRRDLSRSVFDELGLTYLGPVDGHDIAAVEAALHRARAVGRAVLVQCATGPASPATTGRRTTGCGTCPCSASSPGCGWPRRVTHRGCARCCGKPSRTRGRPRCGSPRVQWAVSCRRSAGSVGPMCWPATAAGACWWWRPERARRPRWRPPLSSRPPGRTSPWWIPAGCCRWTRHWFALPVVTSSS